MSYLFLPALPCVHLSVLVSGPLFLKSDHLLLVLGLGERLGVGRRLRTGAEGADTFFLSGVGLTWAS